MKRFTLLLLIIPMTLNAADPCEKYTKKIDKIKEKMRLGYTVKQGEKLKTKLTKLQNARVKCERGN
jgi:hypothetical protein